MDDDIGNNNNNGEFWRIIKVCFTIFASLTYSYFISKNIPKGFYRLLSIVPIIFIFILLPLYLTSLHFTFLVGFLISWLANFKLLLFSFDSGPLCISSYNYNYMNMTMNMNMTMTLPLFISIACLPIKIKQKPASPDPPPNKDVEQKPASSNIHYYYVIEALLLGLSLRVYEYKQYFDQYYMLHPSLMMKFLYFVQMCMTLELLLAISAALVWVLFGMEVEPQFVKPFLSTSIQDLWGRRWNLVVSSILRSTIYEPVRRICSSRSRRRGGLYVAVVATFVVSGVMHELLFFYMSRMKPLWDVTWFFVLSGICTAVEIAVKKALDDVGGGCRWRLNRLVSTPLTIGFTVGAFLWLVFPEFERIGADVRLNQEIANFGQFTSAVVMNSWLRAFNSNSSH